MAVYRIVGPLGEAGLVYYGSTWDVKRRWLDHKKVYRTGKVCPSSKRLFDEYGVEACRIEVVEEAKEDLIERERWWVENHECVNKQIPGRTRAEWYQDNRDERISKMAMYNQANRERLLAQKAEYYQANKDEINRKRRELAAAKKVSQ